MPKILHPAEEKIKRAIRDMIVIDPMVSLRGLQKSLEAKNIQIGDVHYIAKLVRKINRESVEKVDRTKVSERVSEMKERYRVVFDRLIRIAFYTDDMKKEGMPPPSYRDQISALNAIMKNDMAVFSAELDSGIFERHIGTIGLERRFVPLPAELKNQIMSAFSAWGLTVPEPLKIEAKVLNTNGESNNTNKLPAGNMA